MQKIFRIFPLITGHNNQETIGKKEETDMAEISVLDLQNLRHLIGGYDTSHCKMQDYAS